MSLKIMTTQSDYCHVICTIQFCKREDLRLYFRKTWLFAASQRCITAGSLQRLKLCIMRLQIFFVFLHRPSYMLESGLSRTMLTITSSENKQTNKHSACVPIPLLQGTDGPSHLQSTCSFQITLSYILFELPTILGCRQANSISFYR